MGTWGIVWDKGFGNWSRTGLVGEQGIRVLIGLGMGNDGVSQPVTGFGNVVVQLGVSTTSESTLQRQYHLASDARRPST